MLKRGFFNTRTVAIFLLVNWLSISFLVCEPAGHATAVVVQCPPGVPFKGPWRLIKQVMSDECKTVAMCAEVGACQQQLIRGVQLCEQVPVKVTSADVWHLCIADVRRHEHTGMYKIFGFHWDHNAALQQAGVIKLLHPTIHAQTGTTFCALQIGAVYKPKAALFPAQWSLRTIIDHIVDSLHRLVRKKQESDRFILVGQTADGLYIQTIINTKGALITAYPVAQAKGSRASDILCSE